MDSVAFAFSNTLTAVLQFAFLDGNLMPPPPLLPPIIQKAREFQKKNTSISALLTMPKPLTVWITINWENF